MRSICLFASHFDQNFLPYYVKVYLTELKQHFTELVLLVHQDLNTDDTTWLNTLNIQYRKETNEGYDFGMWYKSLNVIDTSTYNRIALVNDSCILFQPLHKFMLAMERSGADFYGMSESEAVSKHVQSYFLVLNKNAIAPAFSYFQQMGIQHKLQEVIQVYEIGLCQHLLKSGLVLGSYVDNKAYKGEFSPYYHLLDHHLAQGIPLIKKKVIFSSYRKDELFTLARMNFKIRPAFYLKLILNNPDSLLERDALKKDITGSLSIFERLRYEVIRWSILTFKTLKRVFTSF